MANQGEFHAVMKLIFEGKLKPIIDKKSPFKKIKDAARYLSVEKRFGKFLIPIS